MDASDRLKTENKRLRELLKNLAEGPLQVNIASPGASAEETEALTARRDNVLAAAQGRKFSVETPLVAIPGQAVFEVDGARLSNILCETMFRLMDDGVAKHDCTDACMEAITVLWIKAAIGSRCRVITMVMDYSDWDKP
jgi:hypothetical protein